MLTIHSKQLASYMKAATAALPNVAWVPIMEYVLLEPGKITAIGPEMSLQMSAPIEGNGSVCVHPSTVLPIVASLNCEVSISNGKVSWEGGHVTFPATDGYPEFVRGEMKSAGTLPGKRLSDAIKTVIPFIDDSLQDMSPMRHVWVDLPSGVIYAGGTTMMVACDIAPGGNQAFPVSKQMASKVAGLLDATDEVIISTSENSVFFQASGLMIGVTMPDAKMPPYSNVFAKIAGQEYKQVGDVQAIIPVVKSIQAAFGMDSITRLNSMDGTLTVSFTDFDGGKEMSQSIESMEPFAFIANTKQFVTCAAVSEKMFFLENDKPVYFTGPTTRSLFSTITM